MFAQEKEMYQGLMGASEVHALADRAGIADDAVSIVIPDAVAYIPLSDLSSVKNGI